MRRPRGFTLWELLCTVMIAGITLAAGVPAFRTVVLDARLTADVNGWILAIQLARNEAAKLGRPVIVCQTNDTWRCGTADLPVDSGWMVYVNLDDQYPPQRSAAEPLLYVHQRALAGRVLSNRPYYEFRPGRRSTNGTIVLCDERGTLGARAVIVSYTGRPRVDRVDANGKPLRCALVT